MGEWCIRAARPGDHQAVQRLWHDCADVRAPLFADAAPFARYLVRNPGCSQVAVDAAGTVIGVVLAGHDGVRGSLHHLAVDHSWRRRGIARRLVTAALRALADADITATMVWIYARNTDGNAFWAALGYQPWEDCPTWSRRGPPP